MFVIEPKYQKCATQVEYWKKGDLVLERTQLWRWAKVYVEGESLKKIKDLISEKDVFDRVCISDLFDEPECDLQDCVSDDLYFPDDIPLKDQRRMQKLFQKDPEKFFEQEEWEISETKLMLESTLDVTEKL